MPHNIFKVLIYRCGALKPGAKFNYESILIKIGWHKILRQPKFYFICLVEKGSIIFSVSFDKSVSSTHAASITIAAPSS